jgi:hypothetical protein
MFLPLVLTAACAPYATHARDVRVAEPAAEPPATSLIPTDAHALTDAEIHQILAAQPTLPPRIRVGLVHLSHRSLDEWFGEQDPQRMIASNPHLVATLRHTEMVKDASYLPVFLVSASPTIAQLREAGARYQADVVLVFSTNCRLYPEYKLFEANEVRAYCSADSALLDVRTGLVPWVSRSGQDITVKEARSEYHLGETIQRAELAGIDRAMQSNATELVLFLRRVTSTPAASTPAAPSP